MSGSLRAGIISSPHGLDGSFKVITPNPALLAVGVTVAVGDAEHEIVRLAGTADRPIVRLGGCEDRDHAVALRGLELSVSRDVAPHLGPEEWWAEDLEGCEVHHDCKPIGTVRRLLALPSCEVLEVTRGEGESELLVPLVSDAVREVDVARRLIEIDLEFLGER